MNWNTEVINIDKIRGILDNKWEQLIILYNFVIYNSSFIKFINFI